MARTVTTSPERVLELFSREGELTLPQVREALGVSERTVQRRLHELMAQGALRQVRHGLYSQGDDIEPGTAGAELVAAIQDVEADAHLTGYDVLAGYAHQFTYDYPHVVSSEPAHVSGLTARLNEDGFLVVPAGPRALIGHEPGRTVILRRQAQTHGRYAVTDNVASPEKAWVDLLREVRRSRLPFDYGELGRILRNLELSGRNLTALKAYARRVGYLDMVRAALGDVEPQSREERRLAAGYGA